MGKFILLAILLVFLVVGSEYSKDEESRPVIWFNSSLVVLYSLVRKAGRQESGTKPDG